MAHQFPDCIGDVDVVSDAENIRKLLKIPFNSKAHVSMMIHRVGKTLLIDDFDIYKYLLRQSEKEWQWLRKFFLKTSSSLLHVQWVCGLLYTSHEVWVGKTKIQTSLQEAGLLLTEIL